MSHRFASLYELIRHQAVTAPTALAIAADGCQPLAYARLLDQVHAVAGTLRALGVAPDDRVVLVVPNGPEAAVAFMAITAAAVVAPLNPTYGEGEFAFFLEDLSPKLVIVDETLAASPAIKVAGQRQIRVAMLRRPAAAAAGLFVLDAETASGPVEVLAPDTDAHALLLHTSGTTARPKLVPLTHANLCESASNIARTLRLTPVDRCLNVMPLFHVHGLIGALLSSMHAGATVFCSRGFDAPRILPTLIESAATWYTAVPTMHQAVAARAAAQPELAVQTRLRFIRSSSAALPPTVMADLEARFRVPVVEAYGMTEAAHQIACNPLPPAARKPGSVGLAAGPDVAVMDDGGALLGRGEVGEIVLRGANVTRGYVNDPSPERTRVAGWFRTGDVGRIDDDGYIFLVARAKELINRGGEKIAPAELEDVLLRHPAVAQAVAFAMPHPTLGEDVAAAVVSKAGVEIDEGTLRQFMAEALAPFKVPRRIVFLDEIPKGPTGKLRRIGLAGQLGLEAPPMDLPQDRPFAPPVTSTERALAALWIETLGVDRAGRDDDFFMLGGDSLLAARVLERVEQEIKVSLSFLVFQESPTLQAMARAIDAVLNPLSGPESVGERQATAVVSGPLSSAQARVRFLQGLSPASPVYNRPLALHIEGPLDTDALASSVRDLLARHEALRATFPEQSGEPVQVIAPAPETIRIERASVDDVDAVRRDEALNALLHAEARRLFDLRTGPLFRPLLVRVAPREHVLLLAMHHIIVDGLSAGILADDLRALYAARVQGEAAALPPVGVTYSTFVERQHGELASSTLASLLSYWTERLAGAPPAIDLPTDRPRPGVQTYNGRTLRISIPSALSKRLEAVGRSHSSTPFMTLLAAFTVLLHRHSGATDLVVGTPVGGRTGSGLDRTVGLFVNTLAIRSSVNGSDSFRHVLGRIRESVLGAFAHQALPFERLVEEMRPDRDLGRSPVFQVMFSYRPPRTDRLEAADVVLRPMEVDTETAKFDLTLEVASSAEGFRAAFEYNTDLFDDRTIERLAGHYVTLLDAMSASPDAPVGGLAMLGRDERRQLVDEWSERGATIDGHPFVHELFASQVAATPDAVAVTSGRVSLSYAELDRRASWLAHRLRALGVGPEVVVGVCLERGTDLLASLLAILKAGGAYLPLDPDYPEERLAYMLADSQAPVVVSQSSLVGRLGSYEGRVALVDALDDDMSEQEAPGPVRLESDGLAYLIYTSGSTGVPKGVEIPHRALGNLVTAIRGLLGFERHDVLLAVTSMSFDIAGLELFVPITAGARVDIARREIVVDPQALRAHIESIRPTVLQATPSMWHALVGAGWAGDRALTILCGGEALSQSLASELIARAKRVWNVYGPTETTIWSTAYEVQTVNGPIPIGRPLANNEVYVLDASRQLVPRGVRGELCIGGAGLARGYRGQPEMTAQRFVPDPFSSRPGARLYRTGDLVRYRPDGLLEFIGRADAQVKLRGHRIELGEIEAALQRLPEVRESAVAVQSLDEDDDRLVAYVLLHPERQLTLKQVRGELKRFLPQYMLPSALVVMPAFPRTANGKLDRRALEPPEEWRAPEHAEASARSPIEDVLCALWGEVLGAERVSRDDSFFDLGGHSLLAARLIVRIREALGVELPLASLFEKATVAETALAIESVRQGNDRALMVRCGARESGVPIPLSFGQHRLWVLDQLDPGVPTYNIASALRMQGALNPAVLERALIATCRRHEALRTVFVEEDGGPRQVVRDDVLVDCQVRDMSGRHDTEVARVLGEWARRPFNLAAAPPIRSLVVRRGDSEHVWLLVVHHIVADAWSLDVLYREVFGHYASIQEGLDQAEATLPLQFADFAIWERSRQDDQEMARQLTYWRKQLAAPLPSLRLPSDHPRRARAARRGHRMTFEVPAHVEEGLRGLGRQERTTPFMTFLAAFQTLLLRYSGLDDVLVGAPITSRPTRDLEGVIGYFLNTLVFRGDLSEDPSFRTLLARTRATALDAYASKDIPFERVVEDLQPGRAGDNPFFDVMFTLQDEWRPAAGPSGLAVEPYPVDTGTAKCELSLMLATSPTGLRGTLEYDADLFDPASVSQLARCYVELLSAIVEHPDHRLSELRLLPVDDRPRVLERGRGAVRTFRDCVVHELIESQVDRTPELPALAYEGQVVSYRAIDLRANRLAWKLAELDIKPNDRVALVCERSPELLVGMLAILKAGAAFVPLDPSHPPERLGRLLQESDAAAVITTNTCRAGTTFAHPHVICVDDVMAEADLRADRLPARAAPSDLAYVIYTSGSTGDPKAVGVEHRQLVNYVQGIIEVLDVSALPIGATWATLSSIAADLGHTAIFPSLCTGGCLHILSAERAADPVALREYFRDHPIDCLKVVPSHFAALMASSDPACVVPRHRLVFGGEALPTALVDDVRRVRADTKVFNHYGPTETTVGALTYAVGSTEWVTPSVPIGVALPNVTAHVVDSAGSLVPEGVVGELVISGAGVARGYLNDAELTRARFVSLAPATGSGSRGYRTGDVVRMLMTGHVEFIGRADGQVKIRGHRIEVGEVEAALRAHPGIREAAVGVRDDGHRRLVAYVVMNPPYAPIVDGHVRYRLPNNLSVVHLNRNETDYLYEEIFERQPYVKFLDALPERATIVDVGANIGLFGLFATRVCREPRVIAVEPNPTIVELLRANFSLHQVNGTVVACGLGQRAEEGAFTFFEGMSLLSGFHADAEVERATVNAFLRNQTDARFDGDGAAEARLADDLVRERLTPRTFTVPRRTLSDLIDELGIARIDLLKINVEKSERDVLLGIRPEHWDLIQHVVLEVDLDEHLRAIVGLLRDHGFTPHVEQDRYLASTALRYVWGSRSPVHARSFEPSMNWPRRIEPISDLTVTAEQVRTFLSSRLTEPMMPSAFVWLDQLPRTAAGKIDRRALSTVELPAEHADGFVEPQGEIEASLAAIWQDVLDVDRVGRHDNFFEHGGDSLLSIRIVARATERGLRITPRQIFQHQTIAELAPVVERSHVERVETPSESGLIRATPIQRWFFEQAFADPGHFTQARLLESADALHIESVHRAVDALVAHHDALRLRVVRGGTGWALDCPSACETTAVSVVDLSGTPAAEMDEAVARACEAVQAATDLEQGPLFRVAVLRLGSGRGDRLLLSAHHLAVDDVSWNVLLEDFETAYAQARQGQIIGLPTKTASFRAWSEHLGAVARQEWGTSDAGFWFESADVRSSLPCDFVHGPNDQASARTASLQLDAELTRALTADWPTRARIHVHEVALAAWLLTVEKWTGVRTLRVDVEEHGRDAFAHDLDVSRTVGWFTALYPLTFDWRQAADRWATLVEVHKRVAQFKGRGAEFGLLRYPDQGSAVAASLQALPRAEILFNFRGRIDHGTGRGRSFRRAREPKGASRSPSQMRTHPLELSFEIEDAGLRLSATWSEHLHRRATMEALLDVWKGEMEALFLAVPSVAAGVTQS